MCAKNSVRLTAIYRYLAQEFELAGAELEDLISSLQSNLRELQTCMHDSLEAERWQDLSRAGHSLKGVAGNVGDSELQQLGLALETVAESADKDKAQAVSLRIDAVLADIC